MARADPVVHAGDHDADVTRDAARARGSDLALLYAARAARNFGDGFAVIILPAYLAGIGFSPRAIGIVATAALRGSALLTLAVGLLAPRFDLPSLLIAGALLMAATGIAMPNTEAIALNCRGGFHRHHESGDRRPRRDAMLAREASEADRTKVICPLEPDRAVATAAGALAAATSDLLLLAGLAALPALKAMLYGYALLGLFGAACCCGLPRAKPAAHTRRATPLGPSRRIVYLAALFCIDAFAGGFAVQSLVALWLFECFGLSLASASVFFACSARCRFRRLRGSQAASAWSTRWCSRTCRRACA